MPKTDEIRYGGQIYTYLDCKRRTLLELAYLEASMPIIVNIIVGECILNGISCK
jgi:hypothetical protein